MLRFLVALTLTLAITPSLDAQNMPPGMHRYIFGLIRRGPAVTEITPAEAMDLQRQHLANIERLARLGKIVAAGPFEGGDDWRGIFIYNVSTKAEAQALVDSDPLVKAGRLVVDLVPWWASDGLLDAADAWIAENPAEPDATTPAPTLSVEEIAHTYLDHYMAGRLDALGEHLAWHAHFEDPTLDVTGREEILEALRGVFATLTIESFEREQVLVSAKLVLFTGQVRFTQATADPNRSLVFDLPMSVGLTIEHGKVVSHVDYLDDDAYTAQLTEQMSR